MIQIYKSRDLGLFSPLLSGGYVAGSNVTGGDFYSEFSATMINKRNHVMADRAARYLSKGGAFIAVGALHLQGQEGLVELIRRQGYTVTAVE